MITPPIKKYVLDESPGWTWEERYKKLEAHHEKETTWAFKRIEALEYAVQYADRAFNASAPWTTTGSRETVVTMHNIAIGREKPDWTSK